jgi:arylformamidase
MAINHERRYNPRTTVPDRAEIASRWAAEGERVRAQSRCRLDVPYGIDPMETMDLFLPEGKVKGLLMFIHGGYWRANDKRDFSFIAPAFTRAGVMVAMPNYSLCPAVTVDVIVRQMLQACAWLHRNGRHFEAPAGDLVVSGHSAGGHLTAMMLAALWPVLASDLPARVVRAGISLSGLYDVRPLMAVQSINAEVRLDEAMALKVSPALMPPATDAPLHTFVGGDENEGFHIQNRLIARAWPGVHRRHPDVPGANHFTLLDHLANPLDRLNRQVLDIVVG